MKRIIGTLMFAFVLTSFLAPAYAQIPNPGFETWAGMAGYENPTGWTTSNIPGFAAPVTKSTSVHSGSLATKGDVVDLIGLGTYPPWLWATFSYTGRPGALTGYYKFTSVSRDSLVIFVATWKGSLASLVADGDFGTVNSVSAFTKFSVPLTYSSAQAPDTAWIEIVIDNGLNDTLHVGSGFVLDDLAFEGTATDVADGQVKPASFALEQNYPNPFNPETAIRYDVPEASHVRLSVFNPLGQEVAALINEQEPAGSYQVKFNGSNLPSGMYFYRLEATPLTTGQSFVQTRRLVLVR